MVVSKCDIGDNLNLLEDKPELWLNLCQCYINTIISSCDDRLSENDRMVPPIIAPDADRHEVKLVGKCPFFGLIYNQLNGLYGKVERNDELFYKMLGQIPIAKELQKLQGTNPTVFEELLENYCLDLVALLPDKASGQQQNENEIEQKMMILKELLVSQVVPLAGTTKPNVIFQLHVLFIKNYTLLQYLFRLISFEEAREHVEQEIHQNVIEIQLSNVVISALEELLVSQLDADRIVKESNWYDNAREIIEVGNKFLFGNLLSESPEVEARNSNTSKSNTSNISNSNTSNLFIQARQSLQTLKICVSFLEHVNIEIITEKKTSDFFQRLGLGRSANTKQNLFGHLCNNKYGGKSILNEDGFMAFQKFLCLARETVPFHLLRKFFIDVVDNVLFATSASVLPGEKVIERIVEYALNDIPWAFETNPITNEKVDKDNPQKQALYESLQIYLLRRLYCAKKMNEGLSRIISKVISKKCRDLKSDDAIRKLVFAYEDIFYEKYAEKLMDVTKSGSFENIEDLEAQTSSQDILSKMTGLAASAHQKLSNKDGNRNNLENKDLCEELGKLRLAITSLADFMAMNYPLNIDELTTWKHCFAEEQSFQYSLIAFYFKYVFVRHGLECCRKQIEDEEVGFVSEKALQFLTADASGDVVDPFVSFDGYFDARRDLILFLMEARKKMPEKASGTNVFLILVLNNWFRMHFLNFVSASNDKCVCAINYGCVCYLKLSLTL